MAAAAGPRKTVSIYDYPEHLNPFRDDDNHNKIRFWTLGRKLNRSNSINFSGIKTDLKNSWAFRSFMKKGKKAPTAVQEKNNVQVNGNNSPIVFRRALQYSSASSNGMGGSRTTIGSPERPDRYVYGGSVTPLPRSRFQERLRSPNQTEGNVRCQTMLTPRLARSDVTGSRLSMESTNPFDEEPVPPVRASRRKKKKAPLPPGLGDVSITSTQSTISETVILQEVKETSTKDVDLDTEDMSFNIELKIVEDEDPTVKVVEEKVIIENNNNYSAVEDENKNTKVEETKQESIPEKPIESTDEVEHTQTTIKTEVIEIKPKDEVTEDPVIVKQKSSEDIKKSDSEDDILNKAAFPKIDIYKYRRNSSLNEDDIQFRRKHEDYEYAITNKRSQSLHNNLNSNHITYDINLNEHSNSDLKDPNQNEHPQKVVCKLYDDFPRKKSIDVSISSTEREFIEIDKATRELEQEISKLNMALNEDDNDVVMGNRLSVSEIRKRFDTSSPNPIPKPRRSHYGSNSPINGNY